MNRKRRYPPGTVALLRVPPGICYVQLVRDDHMLGDLLEIFPLYLQEPLDTRGLPRTLPECPEAYHVFSFAPALEALEDIFSAEILGQHPVTSRWSDGPLVTRFKNIDPDHPSGGEWLILDDSGEALYVTDQLAPDEVDLPRWEELNAAAIVYNLEKGWSPRAVGVRHPDEPPL